MSKEVVQKKIMIVEDNQLNQKIANMIIKHIGHKSIQVLDGAKAIETAKIEKPQLVILDINLGEISGIDIAKEMKADDELKDIPIVVVTALNSDEDRHRIMAESCCDDYIAKPFLPNIFVEAISRYMEVKRVEWIEPEDEE
jgi:two-component system cell cycle response regulator DivK